MHLRRHLISLPERFLISEYDVFSPNCVVKSKSKRLSACLAVRKSFRAAPRSCNGFSLIRWIIVSFLTSRQAASNNFLAERRAFAKSYAGHFWYFCEAAEEKENARRAERRKAVNTKRYAEKNSAEHENPAKKKSK